jgi:16S rRNA (cytosine967-C5)-methyltransferase
MLLRMGLYQLRFLTRIGTYAAVNTAVVLAKQWLRAREAVGLVNAVLRRAAANPGPPLPDPRMDRLKYLAVKYSHPEWLVEHMLEWFGESEAQALLASHNEPAPNTVRLNLRQGTRETLLTQLRAEGFELAPWGTLPEAAFVTAPLPPESTAETQGLFTPQSVASQMVARLLAPEKGTRVLDCAAAPGGKTTHLAELTGPEGQIFAVDKRHAGLRAAQKLAQRLGHTNISFVCANLLDSLPFRPQSFEFVLLDAPCTGLGTLRSHPEIRWRLKPDDLARMAALQTKMLDNASMMVKPKGVMVYAVCSFAPTEGIEVVRRFLEHHREFKVDSTGPEFNHVQLAESAEGFLCLLVRPSRDRLDGFFAVRLRRGGEG